MASTSTEPQFHPSLLEIAAILRRPEFLFAITYLAVLLCLLHYQSLWVDEIMQLIGTRSGDLSNTDELVRTGVGSVPLGWLPQLLAIRVLGYSPAVARLPSALASIGCL